MSKKIQSIETAKVSIDLGNAYSNLQADGGVISDWRSVIGRVSSANQLKSLPHDSALKIGDAWYVFGEDAYIYTESSIEDFPSKDRYTSSWYKQLFSYALFRAYGARLSEGVFYPQVISSVPASEFKIAKRVEQIASNLIGAYELQTMRGATLHVVIKQGNLNIIPEGAGSYYQMLSDTRFEKGTWVVLDLGYLTADIVIFKDSAYIADRATSDDNLGVRKVAEAIASYVYAENGPSLDASEYDRDLHCDSIIRGSRSFDIREVRDTVVCEIAERIARFLKKSTTGLNVEGVIVSGGGQPLYTPHIHSSFALIPAINPRRANVNGAYLMLSE